ncbi:MAG: hypothetical protein Q8L64_01420 [bacterium]|nr:hypothetical protein [bacterium]
MQFEVNESLMGRGIILGNNKKCKLGGIDSKMTNSAIASYAILKVNWEQPDRKDYLDNFILIVAEAIRQLPQDVVSALDVQKKIRTHFGFEIPQNTVSSLLSRVRRHGYINLDHGIYTRDNSALSKLNFDDIRQKVLSSHESLVGALRGFVADNYKLQWTSDYSEKALQSYLEEHQIRLLGELVEDREENPTSDLPEPTQQLQYVIAKFIIHLRESKSPILDYLETVVKGNLLANAIFADPSNYARKFKNTTVYLDAPLAIFALGYAGEARKSPVTEFLKLLIANKAQIKIFRHSLEEIIGILSACVDRIRTKQYKNSYGPSVEYFIEKGYTEVDVMMFIENLESDLGELNITTVEKPPYLEYKTIINEDRYAEYLKEVIHYSQDRPLPLERDKDSITSILRLRRGEVFVPVEECVALFVTSNRSLAHSTRRYVDFNFQYGTVPLALIDYELTNLVWLKDPTVSENYPRKRLIADSLASVQPTEALWQKYLGTIDSLEKKQKISSEQYFVLRHSIQAKSELMECTQGEERAFTEGTVQELLDIVELKIRAEDVARANAEAQAKLEAMDLYEKERDARIRIERHIAEKETARQVKYRQRAKSIARFVKILVTVALMAAFGYLSYVISPIGPLNIDPNNVLSITWKLVAFGVFWLLLLLQAINSVIGLAPISIIEKYEERLARYIEKMIVVE